MRFDSSTFEALGGLEASAYALRLAKEGLEEADVLPYFQQKIATMDLPHLEVAVYLLAKVGTKPAWHVVANYLDHPDFRIRFVATKMMRDMDSVDAEAMGKVVAALSRFGRDGLTDELNVLLDRPANDDARSIATAYLSKK